MTSEAIILIVDDLMFLPKLESTLNALNYKMIAEEMRAI